MASLTISNFGILYLLYTQFRVIEKMYIDTDIYYPIKIGSVTILHDNYSHGARAYKCTTFANLRPGYVKLKRNSYEGLGRVS